MVKDFFKRYENMAGGKSFIISRINDSALQIFIYVFSSFFLGGCVCKELLFFWQSQQKNKWQYLKCYNYSWLSRNKALFLSPCSQALQSMYR